MAGVDVRGSAVDESTEDGDTENQESTSQPQAYKTGMATMTASAGMSSYPAGLESYIEFYNKATAEMKSGNLTVNGLREISGQCCLEPKRPE